MDAPRCFVCKKPFVDEYIVLPLFSPRTGSWVELSLHEECLVAMIDVCCQRGLVPVDPRKLGERN